MTDLLAAMDDAAVALLRRVGLGSTTESGDAADGPADPPTVSEQCKVFEATANYVQWREKTKVPPPPDPATQPGAKIAKLRGEFHGTAERRGNRRPKASNGHDPSTADAADPA